MTDDEQQNETATKTAPRNETEAEPRSETEAEAESTAERSSRRALILLASAFHLAAVLSWLGPSGWVRDRVLRVTRPYTLYTRTDQGWGMFAPEPLSVNRRLVVIATLATGESREVDLTQPFNRSIRSWSPERVGKELKAHDRIMSGDEPQYISGFAGHVCRDLTTRFGAPVRTVDLRRSYSTMTVDPQTFRTIRTPWSWGEIGTYDCPRP